MKYREIEARIEKSKYFFFDFDGTLFDTTEAHCKAFNEIFSKWGCRVDYRLVAGLSTKEAFTKLFQLFNLEPLESKDMHNLIVSKQELAREFLSSECKMIDGSQEVLEKCRRNGRLCIVTSASRKTVSMVVDNAGLSSFFDFYVCAEDVSESKPSPEPYNLARQFFSAAEKDCLVFEDSQPGFVSARDAELDCVDVKNYQLYPAADSLVEMNTK